MKTFLPLSFLLIAFHAYTQCPTAFHLTAQTQCPGATLTVDPTPGVSYSKIEWYNGTALVETVNASAASTQGVIVAGGHGNGPAPDQLEPNGLYAYDNGDILVVDVDNHRVQKWTAGATSGVTVAGGNGAGDATNQLNYPQGMVMDDQGNMFIADEINNRIIKWAVGAPSGVVVAGGNGKGAAANQLDYPMDVALDGKGNMYISDWGNARVVKWAIGATSGVTVAPEGSDGIALDKAGNLYVTDNLYSRVVKWAPGATSGVIVAGGNGLGLAANQVDPICVHVDDDGNIFVGEPYPARVSLWTPGATSGITIAGGNGVGSALNQFNYPGTIFFDRNGNMYISDVFNDRVLKWSVGVIKRSHIATTPGVYKAVVTTMDGCVAATNTVTISPTATPAITITTPVTDIQVCSTVTFDAHTTDAGTAPAFQWQVNNNSVGQDQTSYTSESIKDGDVVTCILTSNAACAANPAVVSNPLAMHIDPSLTPKLSINVSDDDICSGSTVTFDASTTNASGALVYQWMASGQPAAATSSHFVTAAMTDGDVVNCRLATGSGCELAVSNSIIMKVHPLPEIPPGQTFTIDAGSTVTLTPVVVGDIAAYAWYPATDLSNSSISEPVAAPRRTSEYTLKVTSIDGCIAEGKILVQVSSPIKLPNAFTPGKGSNDRFYVMGGQYGSIIENFAVFNRYGQEIFEAHHLPLNSRSSGWDGYIDGKFASPGVYIYTVTVQLPDGTRQQYKGTVMVVR